MARELQPPRGVPTAWVRGLLLPLIILAWLVVALIAGWLLSHFTRTILILVLAAVLAFAFTPLANFFARWTKRPIAIALAYIVGLAVIFSFGAYVIATAITQIATLVANLPGYSQQVQALQPQVEGLLTPLGVDPNWLRDLESQGVTDMQGFAGAVARDILPRIAEFFGTLIDLVVVLILSIYLCSNGASIAQWLKTETPGAANVQARALVQTVNRVVGGYVRGVLALALLVGVLVGVGMAVLGVPYAVLLGLLAFFMEFVPILGVFISGAASLVIAAVSFQEPLRPLIVLAYFVIVHVIEGDVVGPRIMGKAVGIHPATGIIALIAGTEVFGVWGALFAAPLAGLVQAIVYAAWLELRGVGTKAMLETAAKETDIKAQEHAQEHVGVP